MTEPALERRRKKTSGGALLGVAYAACFVFAVVASVAVIYTGNDTLMRFGFVFALWAALGWAFIADHSRRKAELVSAKASDYKLIYDLQLEREIAARHHYELSLENELRRQLTAEADTTTHNALAELQQQVVVLRSQLQELLDQDLEYDQPALKARATRLDELLVARQSLGAHEAQPRKRAAEDPPSGGSSHEPREWGTASGAGAPPSGGGEPGPPKLWLPSQSDQGRREPAQPQHTGVGQGQFETPKPEPLAQVAEAEPVAPVAEAEPIAEPVAQTPEPVVEERPPVEQPVVWQQQQPQGAAWEGSQNWAEEQPAASQQPEPVAHETAQALDYPSWYAQPTTEQETEAESSSEYPSWYSQPAEPELVVQESGPAAHEPEPEHVEVAPQPLVSEPESAAHAPEPAEPEPEPEHVEVAPQPLVSAPEPAEPEPEPVAHELEPEHVEVAPQPQAEAAHGKSEKSKHAGKASGRAKPNESRGGRRAKSAEGGEAAASTGGHDAAAAAAALAGAHASGHSVGELLSRLTPDEAAGYHGRRRRAQMSEAQMSDDEAN
ncbi:MAG: DUF6779 domain-containing protein [Segniliparus sp.]|uniref:DUF6779 domain-containing protein n=1 Tax=Segniliparus sp. TaxID=2804064 RepID=UPI003F3E97AA